MADQADKKEVEKKEKGVFDLVDFKKQLYKDVKKISQKLEITPMGLTAPKGTNGAVSTGALSLDLIMGGGYPRHRMTTIAGKSFTGKTTLAAKAEGIAIRRGMVVHHLDLEGAMDDLWARRNGTDINLNLGTIRTNKKGVESVLVGPNYYYIPDCASGDVSFQYMSRVLDSAIEANAMSYDKDMVMGFFHDSLAACVPGELMDNDEQASMALQARMFSRYLPMVRSKLRKANSFYVAINQIREKPGVLFGSPEYEPGGNSPTFYADIKLRLSPVGSPKMVIEKQGAKADEVHPIVVKENIRAGGLHNEINPDGSVDGYMYTHVKTFKNRVFSPLKETFFRIWSTHDGGPGYGIDPVWDTLRFFEEVGMASHEAVKGKNFITLKGSTYDYFDLKQEILTKPDLQAEAQELLQSGRAFELYFNRLAGKGIELPEPDSEQNDADEDAAEAAAEVESEVVS